MDANYIEKGELGKTCADCKHFESEIASEGIGKCFGNDVKSSGSCNFFEAK